MQNPENLKYFQKQDANFQRWLNLCIQIKTFLEQDNFDFFYSEKDASKKNLLNSFEKDTLQKKFINLLIEDLCNFENSIKGEGFTSPSDINLETINERIENAQEENYKIFGIKRGKPITAEMLLNHCCIRSLSYILRIDTLFNDPDFSSKIEDIPMTHSYYGFIYDFMLFFGILDYDFDINNTTQKEDVIKQRFKNPPLKNNPFLDKFIQTRESLINESSIMIKRINNPNLSQE